MIKVSNNRNKKQSYTSIYGSRRSHATKGDSPKTIVNFSYLLPRKGINLEHLQHLTPEWKKQMEYIIKNAGN